MMSFDLAVNNILKARLKRVAGLLVLCLSCLPGEPTITIDFVLPTETPLPIAINTTTTPEIVVTVGGEALSDASYRLESLDDSIVSVTTDGKDLIGLVRDTAVIRVVFGDASGEADSTFTVVGVASNVRVTPPTDTLVKIGETIDLTAEAFDANDLGLAVTSFVWSSSDSSVVTVDGNGTATAVNEGTAEIRAMVDGVADSASLVMQLVVTDVTITEPLVTLHALTWTHPLVVLARGADNQVITGLDNSAFTWTSSNTAITTVDSSGILTARGNGTAFVRAELGGEVDSVLVTIDQIALAVFVDPDDPNLARTDTTTLTATPVDSAFVEIQNPTVAWTSSNEPVATISAGLVTALTLGAATITAEVDGVVGTASVNVLEPQLLVVTPSTKTIDAWLDTTRLVPTVRDGSNTVIFPVTIAWTTDDPSIATVVNDGSNGIVTGRGNGTATVTATAPLGVTNTATISVNQLPVSSVAVTPLGLDASTTEGPKGPLVATALDGSGNPIPGVATWRSLNPYRATIDSMSGMVTAHASGQVTMAATIAGVTSYGLVTVAAPDASPVQTWTQESDLGPQVGAIWGLSPTMIWASTNPGIWMYDGSGWSQQSTETGGRFWGASATDVWARQAGGLLHWDGTAWSPHQVTFAHEGLGQIWGSSPDNVWITTLEGKLYHYDGVAWTFAGTLSTGNSATELRGIWGSAANDIWVVGSAACCGFLSSDTTAGGHHVGLIELFRLDGSGWHFVTRPGAIGLRTALWLTSRGQTLWGNASDDVWRLSSGGEAGDCYWIGCSVGFVTTVSHFQGMDWSKNDADTLHASLDPSMWGSSTSEMYAALPNGSTGRARHFTGGAWAPISGLPNDFNVNVVWGTSDGPVWISGNSAGGGLLRGVRQ